MLQRLGGRDLHFRHGETAADAHALASWKNEILMFLSLTLAEGCAINPKAMNQNLPPKGLKFAGSKLLAFSFKNLSGLNLSGSG